MAMVITVHLIALSIVQFADLFTIQLAGFLMYRKYIALGTFSNTAYFMLGRTVDCTFVNCLMYCWQHYTVHLTTLPTVDLAEVHIQYASEMPSACMIIRPDFAILPCGKISMFQHWHLATLPCFNINMRQHCHAAQYHNISHVSSNTDSQSNGRAPSVTAAAHSFLYVWPTGHYMWLADHCSLQAITMRPGTRLCIWRVGQCTRPSA